MSKRFNLNKLVKEKHSYNKIITCNHSVRLLIVWQLTVVNVTVKSLVKILLDNIY